MTMARLAYEQACLVHAGAVGAAEHIRAELEQRCL